MIIAVNTITPGINSTSIRQGFIYEVFSRIIKENPEHSFVFIFDTLHPVRPFTGNSIMVKAPSPPRHPAMWDLWNNFKIYRLLKKYKADVFVNFGICLSHAKIPQCMILQDMAFLHKDYRPKNHARFYKKNMQKFLNAATAIVVTSQFCKMQLLSNYQSDGHKINVVLPGVDEIFKPAEIEYRQKLKEQYSEGYEYFLVNIEDPRQDVLNLLKAFSIFKKKLKSSMRLLILHRDQEKKEASTELVRLYKYGADVQQLWDIPAIATANVTAGAYAAIYPFSEGDGSSLISSMQSGIPVISAATEVFSEICVDAALYIDPANPSDIADKMMLLFKDERVRKELIVKGLQQVKKYSLQSASQMLWASIVNSTA